MRTLRASFPAVLRINSPFRFHDFGVCHSYRELQIPQFTQPLLDHSLLGLVEDSRFTPKQFAQYEVENCFQVWKTMAEFLFDSMAKAG